jgi:N-acetyl sugar amidotransferase
MRDVRYRQCSRCVMDTSDAEITFDSEGQCNHCTTYVTRIARRARRGSPSEQLAASIARMKRAGRSGRYDCVVGISGGADSAYVAYLAVSHGLRVLAVHMDNGWNTAVGVSNLKTLLERLRLDYTSCVLDWEQFKDLQLAFLKASVPEIETPTDIAIPAALHRVAAENDIRHIVMGGNSWTEGILPKAWHYNAKDLKYLKAIHRRFGTRSLGSFPTFGYQQEAYYKLVKGIRFEYLLEHVHYRADAVDRILRDEIGWQDPGGKHHESTITRFVQSYIYPMKFNMDYRRATYSSQICTGQLTREWAVEELQKPPYDAVQIARDKHFVAKKFGITVPELDRIVALPPKSHRDYPNDRKFLEGLYRIYQTFLARR